MPFERELLAGGLVAAALGAGTYALARHTGAPRVAARVQASSLPVVCGGCFFAGVALLADAWFTHLHAALVSSFDATAAGVFLCLGSALAYAHLELLAAVAGFRRLDVDLGRPDRAGLLGRWAGADRHLAGWYAYVSERHALVPFAAGAAILFAIPAAFLLPAVAGEVGTFEVWLAAATALGCHAAALFAVTGARVHHLPDEPGERVREALRERA